MSTTKRIPITIALNESESNPVFMGSHWLAELRNEAAAALDGYLGIQTWAGEGDPTDSSVWTWMRNPNGAGGIDAGTILGMDSVAAYSAYPLPAEVSVAQWMRFKSHDGTGTETTQTAARTLYLLKKELD
jgi:hypothetical protein